VTTVVQRLHSSLIVYARGLFDMHAAIHWQRARRAGRTMYERMTTFVVVH